MNGHLQYTPSLDLLNTSSTCLCCLQWPYRQETSISLYSCLVNTQLSAMPCADKGHARSNVNPKQTTELIRRTRKDLQKPSSTLLPRPVASLVTLFAHSTSLSLRVGTFLGGCAIDSVRATTLTGLELSRAVVESILVRAGRDVVSRSSDDHGRMEAESLLERSVSICNPCIRAL